MNQDYFDQILLGTDADIDTAYNNLIPFLRVYQDCMPAGALGRMEKQWILMYASLFVDDYREYCTQHCRPALGALRIFLADATQKWLLGTTRGAVGLTVRPRECLYPTYHHVFVEASTLWLTRWDPYGEWEAWIRTTNRSNSSAATAVQAVSEPVPPPQGSIAMMM